MDECFGFLKLIEAETANLPLQGKEETDSPSEISLADTMNLLDAKVNMFINALNDFDAALKAPAGTRRYAAPELFVPGADVDGRADLYALGATLASLLLALHDYLHIFAPAELLPFYSYGFGWLLPAVLGGIIGALLSKPAAAQN